MEVEQMINIYGFVNNISKKYISIIFIILMVSIALFLNAGRFFDITEKPQDADIIVYLGGGGQERAKKALEMYKDGYSKTGKIIFTGPESFYVDKKRKIFKDRRAYFTAHGVLEKRIIQISNLNNTMKEIQFIKDYMLHQHLNKVMFISDPPHSRRIMFLANSIADYDEDGLSCFVVGSDVSWWNKKQYYSNNKAIAFIVLESMKIPINYLAYGVLKKLGLSQALKVYIDPFVYYFKRSISLFFDKIIFSDSKSTSK